MRASGDIAISQVGKHPDGVQPATSFEFRAELAVAGVHKGLMRGISVEYVFQPLFLLTSFAVRRVELLRQLCFLATTQEMKIPVIVSCILEKEV